MNIRHLVRFAALAALTASALLAQTGELAELASEWKTANASFRAATLALRNSEAFRRAQAAGDRRTLRRLVDAIPRPEASDYGRRALALADRRQGDDALAVLTFVANHLYDKAVFAGMADRIERDHLGAAGLDAILENGIVLGNFLEPARSAALLTRIANENEHPLPRAWALYWQSMLILRDPAAGPAERERAAALQARVTELAPEGVLADRVAAPAFEREHLQVGMVAPEIVGRDTEGRPLRLSEFRGRVVVLEFWGFWCGPCVAAVPAEQALVEKLAARPFVLLGVDSDRDLDYYHFEAETKHVTWRSFWCGEKGVIGAIPSKWNVTTWPRTYVLDHEGVIRFKDVRGKALEEVLEPLLAAIER
ncbi:MAG: TlpA family protein disulfide reductase [Planctomycetes bacterium]|nr:TlpA family protein disulfide reductase [Planctomycetota bacterium]